jgi:hypothetical protein
MATLVPTVTFNYESVRELNPTLSTNFHGINVALRERVVGKRLSILRYAGTGTTDTVLRLGYPASPPGSTPWGLLLVRVRETSAPGTSVSAMTPLNFSQDGATLYTHEPSGLVANTFYDLEFLVLES